MSRTRKIASAWRTIGRVNRMNKRLCARTGTTLSHNATAKDIAFVRQHRHGVKGSPPLNTHLISQGTRNIAKAFEFTLRTEGGNKPYGASLPE